MSTEFQPLEKVIVTRNFGQQNGRIVGIKNDHSGNTTYMIELVCNDFKPHVSGSKIIRVSPADIESRRVILEHHRLNKLNTAT
ncbi:hypothetical protein [Mangrovibacterium sp.]|uniref:hypothetical protein n=1 Tax=Mangrovibacterium sp. TaxID=1961364 RepID=UPI003566E881